MLRSFTTTTTTFSSTFTVLNETQVYLCGITDHCSLSEYKNHQFSLL